LLEQIDKIFSSYKLNILDNKKNVTIASISSEILSSENADRLNEIYNAVKVFAFCCIAKNQYFESHKNYVNASCFELVSQRFVYDNNMVSLYSYKRDGSTLDGGYKYEDLNILAPVWVRQCHQFGIDEKLLKSIEICQISNRNLYKRIFYSIEWFLLSFTDNPIISSELELACLQTSFEQLDYSKITRKRFYELFNYNINPITKKYSTPKGDWYYEFKQHRNKLLHGSLKKKSSTWDIHTHIIIATIVLISFVKRLLYENNLYKITPEDRVIELAIDIWIKDPIPEKWPEILRNQHWESINFTL